MRKLMMMMMMMEEELVGSFGVTCACVKISG